MTELAGQFVAEHTVDAPEVVRIELPTHYPIGPVNVFLIKDDPLTLVDAGLNNDESWALVEQGVRAAGCEVSDIERVLLTHGHTDHVGLLRRVLDVADAKVYAHTYCAERLRDPEKGEALASTYIFDMLLECGVPAAHVDKVREVRASFKDLRITAPVDGDLEDGDTIGRYTVHHAPGHSPADILFVDEPSRTAFTGDHIIESVTPVAMLRPVAPGEPRPKMLVEFVASLRKTRDLDLDVCYSGHGKPVTDHCAAIDKILSKQDRRTNRVRTILAEGEVTPYQMCQSLFGTLKDAFMHMSMAVALGHLDALEHEGEAVSETRDGVLYFRAARRKH
jgi:glyoxylase-like metal-dependent hydrolase (beta-lactamase superfamily II)